MRELCEGKGVLITGASGSFGRACVPELIRRGARRIVIYSRDEAKQADMRRKLHDPHGVCRFAIGDVRDLPRLKDALYGVDWIISAAAIKRIEVAEENPQECLKTNVIGTMNVIDAALHTGVKKVVGLSTDKAVDFVNLYGASKFCAERLLLAENRFAGGRCAFAVVQYGNIANSRGSVIPTWREYLAHGTPAPITDPDATRYWMRIEEAVNLVLDTLVTMKGGELVVPTLPAYRLQDLADAIGVKTRIVGMPEWEKKNEVLNGIPSDQARRMTVDELRAELRTLP